MIKKTLLIVLVGLFGLQGFGQDPELFNTGWYFNNMTIDGADHTPNFEEYFYVISLYFDEDGDDEDFFTSACEDLFSNISYQNNTEFNLSNLSQSSQSCEPDFEDFKTLYFNFFYNNQEFPFTYEIFDNTDDKSLEITDSFGNKIYYKNVQPINTLLFQTWELTNVFHDLGIGDIIISNVDPPINPTITIYENLEHTGFVACNSFSGKFVQDYENYISSVDFEHTTNTCINEEHTNVENDFFWFFNSGLSDYNIYNIEDNYFLILNHISLGEHLKFKSTNNLGSEDFINFKIAIYPNPVLNTLFISSENVAIETISVYSLTGKIVLEVKNETNSIDVSSLSKGIYFIEMSSSEGKSIQKFIKN